MIPTGLKPFPGLKMTSRLYFWASVVYDIAGNTKGGSITVPLTFCLTGLESAV
jgi:hypothetical protein